MMNADAVINELREQGVLIDNAMMAGRMPPGTSSLVHPEGVFGLYASGDLFQELKDKLPEPAATPALTKSFNELSNTAPQPAAPTFDPKVGP